MWLLSTAIKVCNLSNCAPIYKVYISMPLQTLQSISSFIQDLSLNTDRWRQQQLLNYLLLPIISANKYVNICKFLKSILCLLITLQYIIHAHVYMYMYKVLITCKTLSMYYIGDQFNKICNTIYKFTTCT